MANPVVHLLQCTKGLYGLSFYLQPYFTLPIPFHALHLLVTLFIGIKNFEQIYAEDGSHSANLQGANGIDFWNTDDAAHAAQGHAAAFADLTVAHHQDDLPAEHRVGGPLLKNYKIVKWPQWGLKVYPNFHAIACIVIAIFLLC